MPFKSLKRPFSTGPLLVSTAPTLCCYRDLMIVAGGREVRTACQQNRELVPTALGPALSRGIMCCYRDLVPTISFLSQPRWASVSIEVMCSYRDRGKSLGVL